MQAPTRRSHPDSLRTQFNPHVTPIHGMPGFVRIPCMTPSIPPKLFSFGECIGATANLQMRPSGEAALCWIQIVVDQRRRGTSSTWSGASPPTRRLVTRILPLRGE